MSVVQTMSVLILPVVGWGVSELVSVRERLSAMEARYIVESEVRKNQAKSINRFSEEIRNLHDAIKDLSK